MLAVRWILVRPLVVVAFEYLLSMRSAGCFVVCNERACASSSSSSLLSIIRAVID